MTDKDVRFTPPEIFEALNLQFDLDPCAAEIGKFRGFVPAKRYYTQADDGLAKPWKGLVFMNCPWTGRHAQVPWIEKFIAHGNGLGICLAYTSADWFQRLMPGMDVICFPKGKTRYILPNGQRDGSPPMGSVLFAIGEEGSRALSQSGLGLVYVRPDDGRRVNRFTDVRVDDQATIGIRVEKKKGGGRRRLTVVANYDTEEVERIEVETRRDQQSI